MSIPDWVDAEIQLSLRKKEVEEKEKNLEEEKKKKEEVEKKQLQIEKRTQEEKTEYSIGS